MNQRLLALFALGSVSVCAVVFTACGGDSTNNDGGSDATTNDVANDTTPPNDTGPGDTGGNDGGNDVTTSDSGCAPGPNCRQCCAQKNPDAAAIFITAETTCACTTPGLCNTNQTCKNNLCQGQNASGGCNACLNDKDSGDCFNAAAAACIQNQACQPLVQCVAQCGTVTDAGGGG
jgi:hypothetical protein